MGEYLNMMQHFISLVFLLSLAMERTVRNGIMSSWIRHILFYLVSLATKENVCNGIDEYLNVTQHFISLVSNARNRVGKNKSQVNKLCMYVAISLWTNKNAKSGLSIYNYCKLSTNIIPLL